MAVGPDGVPQARVDGGEWVINAAMSEKYGALLALINADKLSGYVNGGQMGGGAAQKKKQQFGIGPVGDPFSAMASGVAGLGGAFGAAVGAAAPAWQGFGQTLATTASQFITPALSGIQSQIGQLGISFPQITQMSITPPWVQMANLLSATKTSMLDPMFSGIHQGVTGLQSAFPVMSNIVGSTFLGMAGQILAAKTSTIDPAFAGIEGGLSTVEGAFGNAVNTIGSQWSQIREGTADPVRFTINSVFNQGLVGMWNSVADLIGATKMQPYVAAFATGGYVRGEGGPKSDKIPAVLSNGEFVLNARATQAAGVDNLTRFNAANGAVGPQGLFNQRTGNMHFATGGLADPNSPVYSAMLRGHQFVKRWSGTPYGWGQSLPSDHATDCCLVAETMVYGPDGAMRMDEISSGDRVYSYVDGCREVSIVENAWFTKRQDVYQVRMTNKSVTASDNHPFLRVVQSEPARPPKKGSGSARPGWSPSKYDVEWARTDELRRGDLLVTPKSLEFQGSANTLPSGREVGLNEAWILGLIVGDGSIHEGVVRVTVYGRIREQASDVLLGMGASSTTFTESDGVIAYSTPLSRELIQAGFRGRSYSKRIPACVWSWDEDHRRAFLNGYCDADGHCPSDVKRHGERTYASASRGLIEDARAMHVSLGDSVSNVSTNTREGKKIVIKGKEVNHARPLHTFSVWNGARAGDKYAMNQSNGLRIWVEENDFTVSRVLSVDHVGVEDTYDIEVKDSHNFVANGVVVHNSGLQSGAADVILGGNGMRQWATGGFPGGGGTQGDTVKIGNQVWVKGLGAGHSIGVSTVHTAGTFSGIPGLPNINIESGGGTGGGTTYGGVAQGADSGQFPSRYHLAIVDGQFISGGAGGGSSPSMADLASAAMNPGFQRMLMNAQAYPGNGIIGNLPEWVATALQGPARAKIQQLAAAMTRGPAVGPGGSVERWRPMVIAALKRNGYQATDAEVTAMLAQIQSESGGNERAIQQVQDVNSGGNEAVGLLQIAAGTWPSVRDPSLADDRMDAWANMNAALRYLKMNNKDLLATWGHGHGYANGGTIPGTGWKDIFPALLTPGEEVISKAPATKFRPILKKINDGSMEAIPVVVTNWPENVALGNAVASPGSTPATTVGSTPAAPVTVTGTGTTETGLDGLGTETPAVPEVPQTGTPDASTPQGRTAIQDAVDAAVAAGQAQGIQTAVAVTDTSTGQNYTVNGSEVMPSASEIKLAVALAAMKKVDNGEISMEEVQPNLDPMISNSDNEATNRLIDQLGGIDAVNAEVQGMGVSSSDVTLGRKLGISFSGDDPNKMTVNGANQMLGIIQQSASGSGSISQGGANAIVNAMRNQTVDTKFGAVLPNDQIAHKTGELGGASHDVGYIFDGEKWIAVSVMTNNPNGSDQAANNEIIKSLAQQIYQNRSGGVGGQSTVTTPPGTVDPAQTIDPATGMPIVTETPDASPPARVYTPAWTDDTGMAYETDPVTGVPIDPATKKPFTKDPTTGEEITLDETNGLYRDPRTGSYFYGSKAKELDDQDGNVQSSVTPVTAENTFTFDDPNATLNSDNGDWVENYSGPFSDIFKKGKLLGQLGVAAASPGALQRFGNDQEMNKQIDLAKKREEDLTNYKTTQEQKISELRAQGKNEEAAKLEAESRAKIAALKEMPGTAPGTQAMLATMEKDPGVAWRKQSEDQWKQWLGDNWAGIAETVGVAGAGAIGNTGGGMVINGGINTTDLSGAFRELDRRAARQSRANSRIGRR